MSLRIIEWRIPVARWIVSRDPRRVIEMRMLRAIICLAAVSVGCRSGLNDGPSPVAQQASVTLIADEAEAALAILAVRAASGTVPDSLWNTLWSSIGYRRLAQRERAMRRAFSDSAFRRFLESDTLATRRRALERTLAAWKEADVANAARKAAAYLPGSTPLHALLLTLIKPQTNSFVFAVGTDSAALYLDPDVTREQLEVTLAHELHHVGYAVAREEQEDSTFRASRDSSSTFSRVGWRTPASFAGAP